VPASVLRKEECVCLGCRERLGVRKEGCKKGKESKGREGGWVSSANLRQLRGKRADQDPGFKRNTSGLFFRVKLVKKFYQP